MPTLFDAEILDAADALDEAFASLWTLAPMMAPPGDPNGVAVADPSRPGGAFAATFFDPEQKPMMPNAYDVREYRRPGVEAQTPYIDISPAALAAWAAAYGAQLAMQKPDQVTRDDGAIFSVSSAGRGKTHGFVRVKLNRLSV